MRIASLARLALVAAGVALLPRTGLGADAPAPATDPAALRDRIVHNIAAGLAAADSQRAGAPRDSLVVPVRGPRPAVKVAARRAIARPSHAPAPVAAGPVDDSPDAIWTALLEGNRRFAGGLARPRPFVPERTGGADEPRPRAVVLGCSDSRVSPDVVFDPPPGELYVIRTAANLVDPFALGSLEYAVEHLHVKLLVVLGHVGCGPVEAAATGADLPSANEKAIVDRIRPTVQRLAACFEARELAERSVIANARQGAVDALAGSEILRAAVAHGTLRVVSAIYDPRDGVVTAVSVPAATAQAQAPPH